MSNVTCKDIERMMGNELFDALDQAQKEAFNEHIVECSPCELLFAQLQETIEVVRQAPAPQPPEPYWDGYYDRLLRRMNAADAPGPIARGWQNIRLALSRPQGILPRRVLQAGVAVALIFLGILIGRIWQIDREPAELAGSPPTEEVEPGASMLSARAERYLDRSSILLLGLVNADLSESDLKLLRLERKQELAGELIQEAVLLKSELEKTREQQLAGLVEDLERIMRQIANLELHQDLPSIELIQRGVDRGDLLLKINLEKMKIEESRGGEL